MNRCTTYPTGWFGAPVLAGAVSLFAILSLSCSDATTGPEGPPAPGDASVAFTLNSSTLIQYSGDATWPPAGSGVIAGMDSAGEALQIMGYTQLSAEKSGFAGPEPRFNFIFFELFDSAGISSRAYSDISVVLGLNITLDEVDSMAYFGSSGSLTLTTVSADRVEGTFFGSGTRPSDFDVVTISGGTIGAPLMDGLFAFEDSGSTGGNIPVGVDTGTIPVYSWTGGPVNAVSVSRVSDLNALVWGVLIAGGDSIATGVTHGQIPAGALQEGNLEPVLTTGVAYRVRVSRTDGGYGYTDFIP